MILEQKKIKIINWINKLETTETVLFKEQNGFSTKCIYEHSGTDIIARRQISSTLQILSDEELLIKSQSLIDGRITTYKLNLKNDKIYDFIKKVKK